MYTAEQSDELTTLIDEQFAKLGQQLSLPIEPGDSVFVTKELPAWLGANLEYRLNVQWQAGEAEVDGRFVLSMDVDFGNYHRRMELTSGSSDELEQFATQNPPSRQISEAIFELMAMERAGQ